MFKLILVLTLLLYTYSSTIPLVPLPKSLSLGSLSLSLSKEFHFKQINENNVISNILLKANERYMKLYHNNNKYSNNNNNNDNNNDNIISMCIITVSDVNNNDEIDTLGYNSIEDYQLNIDIEGNCKITSANIWGALNAMETFSQLLERNIDDNNNNQIICNYIPVSIEDSPRWSHRGMLIDTSRHYLSLNMIMNIIDLLSMHKYNVLHWHLVDSQSFPFNSPSSPNLVKGSYSPKMIYTVDDISMIKQYAGERGIRILMEIDVPGHSFSWGIGYPDITTNCPKYASNVNNIALNPALDKTYEIVNGVLSDIIKTTTEKYLHLGGDEVVFACWNEDPSITTFMSENNINSFNEMLGYFVEKVDNMVLSLDATPIHWEEVFTAGVKVPSDTIFEGNLN